jgi:hypothetical protein
MIAVDSWSRHPQSKGSTDRARIGRPSLARMGPSVRRPKLLALGTGRPTVFTHTFC